jgi:hypothetical protein
MWGAKMGEEQRGGGHRLYSLWLAVLTPVVRLWFGLGRLAGWNQAGRRRRLAMVVTALAAASFGTGLTLAFAGTAPGDASQDTTAGQAAAAYRAQAAAWIAGQVGPDVSVSCDPAMCGEVQHNGFPAARLTRLPAAADGPLGAGVVVATPAIRDQFGTRLASAYAPLVLASFGTGAERVDIRVVAPDGAAAFESQLAAEHSQLIAAGAQLLGNTNIVASPAVRDPLLAGRVDSRLLVALSALAAEMPLRLVSFDDSSPGASTAVQLRGAEIGTASPAGLAAVLAFLHAQQAPYLPAAAAIGRGASGQSVVMVRYDAPDLMDVGGS